MDSSGNGLLVCLDDHGICAKDTEQNIHRLCSCLIKHGVIHQAPDEPSEETKRRVLPLLCALLTPSGYVILIYARMHACMYVCIYVMYVFNVCNVCMYVVYACMYVMCLLMYVCMQCMYGCMYVMYAMYLCNVCM